MSNLKFSFVFIILIVLGLCIDSGLTIKCLMNGDLNHSLSCKDCEKKKDLPKKLSTAELELVLVQNFLAPNLDQYHY